MPTTEPNLVTSLNPRNCHLIIFCDCAFLARDSMLSAPYAIAVRPSHGWISQKQYMYMVPPTGAPYTRGVAKTSNFRPICVYISERVSDRGIVTMKDEYKVLCALSISATFDDLEWPRTPVSRSLCSLKANISQTVHPIHSMFGPRLGFSGSADRMELFAVR